MIMSAVSQKDTSYRSSLFGFVSRLNCRLRIKWYKIFCSNVLNDPKLLVWVFRVLRKLRPVAVPPVVPVLVAKATDVRDVLNRMEDFTVADALNRQMPWGPFLIGIDWPEQHQKERHFLETVVGNQDIAKESIRRRAEDKCKILLKKSERPFNVVSDLCNPVVVDVLHNYFGFPLIGGDRQTEDVVKQTSDVLGRVASSVMISPPLGSEIRIKTLQSVVRMTDAIVDRIETQVRNANNGRLPPNSKQDILTRLVAELLSSTQRGEQYEFLDRDWIRRYITGLAVFGGGTITRAATHAVDRLLDKGLVKAEHFKIACESARNIEENINIDANRIVLKKIIYEALRFRPMLPLLVRYTPRETVIGKGSPHARLVPSGKMVLAAPIAAMFDPEEFQSPMRFKIDRCPDLYMHFGPLSSPRHCFGRYVADEVIFEIVRSLLLRKGIERTSTIRYVDDGPAPESLFLSFS
jgi:cytochrome P450